MAAAAAGATATAGAGASTSGAGALGTGLASRGGIADTAAAIDAGSGEGITVSTVADAGRASTFGSGGLSILVFRSESSVRDSRSRIAGPRSPETPTVAAAVGSATGRMSARGALC